MEIAIVSVLVIAAVAAVGGKVVRDARRFRANGPKDCGCGRGASCDKKG